MQVLLPKHIIHFQHKPNTSLPHCNNNHVLLVGMGQCTDSSHFIQILHWQYILWRLPYFFIIKIVTIFQFCYIYSFYTLYLYTTFKDCFCASVNSVQYYLCWLLVRSLRQMIHTLSSWEENPTFCIFFSIFCWWQF